MQIVLTKDVPNLGRKGEIKTVKKGYFRNFLAPRTKAVRVTPKLMKQILEQQQLREKKREEMLAKAEDLVKKLEKTTITFTRKTTKNDKLYAAIAESHIQHELEQHLGFDLDANMIKLAEHIKAVGEYEATVQLTPDIAATVKVVVESEK